MPSAVGDRHEVGTRSTICESPTNHNKQEHYTHQYSMEPATFLDAFIMSEIRLGIRLPYPKLSRIVVDILCKASLVNGIHAQPWVQSGEVFMASNADNAAWSSWNSVHARDRLKRSIY